MSNDRAKRRPWGCFIPIVMFAALVITVAISFYQSNYTLTRENITVRLERLPENFDGMTIAHLSDLHGKSWGENNHDLLRLIEKARPNIIAITGDFIDTPDDIEWADKLVAELVKLAPVYFVSGNHEFHKWRFQELKTCLVSQGVTVLDNDFVLLESDGQQICLAGRPDPNGTSNKNVMSDLTGEIRSLYGDIFILALSHRYDLFDEYKELGLDLVLSGHGHGGMIRLPFTDGLISPYRELWPERTNGLYVEDGTAMVVSRGMDGPGTGFRLFNKPHVIIETLRTAG